MYLTQNSISRNFFLPFFGKLCFRPLLCDFRIRFRHVRYGISNPGTRCNRLKKLRYGYVYIKVAFQNLAKFGGGQFDPLDISAGKVRNGPQMVRMGVKQVILTNKVVQNLVFETIFGGMKISTSSSLKK